MNLVIIDEKKKKEDFETLANAACRYLEKALNKDECKWSYNDSWSLLFGHPKSNNITFSMDNYKTRIKVKLDYIKESNSITIESWGISMSNISEISAYMSSVYGADNVSFVYN